MTALLLDEMLSANIAEQLRGRDVDAVAVVDDAALIATPDEDLLVWSTAHQRVLVTLNVGDFAAIATDWRAIGREHAGIVYVTNRAFPQDRSFVGAIVAAVAACQDTDSLPAPGSETFLPRNATRERRGASRPVRLAGGGRAAARRPARAR